MKRASRWSAFDWFLVAPNRLSPPPAPAIGSVAVKSHLLLAPGITVVIDPHEARLSPEGLRELITALTDAHQHITKVSK